MSDSIEVRDAPGKGKGLFATKDIPRGEIVATGPVMKFPLRSLDGTLLGNHFWSEDGADWLTFGPQTFCNHANDPNCVSVIYNDVDLLVSIQAIKSGEELVLHYGDFSEGFVNEW